MASQYHSRTKGKYFAIAGGVLAVIAAGVWGWLALSSAGSSEDPVVTSVDDALISLYETDALYQAKKASLEAGESQMRVSVYDATTIDWDRQVAAYAEFSWAPGYSYRSAVFDARSNAIVIEVLAPPQHCTLPQVMQQVGVFIAVPKTFSQTHLKVEQKTVSNSASCDFTQGGNVSL